MEDEEILRSAETTLTAVGGIGAIGGVFELFHEASAQPSIPLIGFPVTGEIFTAAALSTTLGLLISPDTSVKQKTALLATGVASLGLGIAGHLVSQGHAGLSAGLETYSFLPAAIATASVMPAKRR